MNSRLALALVVLAACDAPASSSSTPGGSAVASASASAAPTVPLVALSPEYRGTLGKDAIVARLYTAGSSLTGSYFLESDGVEHRLSGSGSGTHLALDETVDKARSGALTLDQAADGVLNGTWTDAGGKTAPVHLDVLAVTPKPASATLFKRTVHATKPVTGGAKDDACKVSVAYAEVFGLPPAIESKLNAELAPPADLSMPAKCEHAVEVTGDYRVAYNADGILSVRSVGAVTPADPSMATRSGRVLNIVLATGAAVRLFGDIVKPKAERTFESAMSQQVEAAVRKGHLDRKAVDQALAFSPPFVVEDKGVRLYPDSLPATYAALVADGLLVRYATLPRPAGPAAVLWGK